MNKSDYSAKNSSWVIKYSTISISDCTIYSYYAYFREVVPFSLQNFLPVIEFEEWVDKFESDKVFFLWGKKKGRNVRVPAPNQSVFGHL